MLVTLAMICSILGVTTAASITIINNNTDDMVALVQIFRHGERTPVSFYANDPYKHDRFWTLELGQLTKKGKKMHYELGQFTRKRYRDFFPKFYYHGWFRAQTTDIDRTHMSCQSNLAGLFNPNENETWYEDMPWQPIPVHAADGRLTINFLNCPLYQVELAKVMIRDPYYVEINKMYADSYAHLSNHSGDNVTTVMQASSIHDTLYIEELHGLEIPFWTNSVYPEPTGTLNGYSFKAYSFTYNMKRLSAGSWLKSAIYDYFSSFFNDTAPSEIFQMWSEHDANIACILNTFGAFNVIRQPAFASSLYFELRNNSGSPYINVYYKDDDQGIFEPITIEGCSFNCSLDGFKTALSDYLIDVDTWNKECSADSDIYVQRGEAKKDPDIAHTQEYVDEFVKLRYSYVRTDDRV